MRAWVLLVLVAGCGYDEAKIEDYKERVTEVRCDTGTDTAQGAIRTRGRWVGSRRYSFTTTDGRVVEVTGPCRFEVIK